MILMAITNTYSANFDLNSLRAFVAFAELLNFTRAAELLHISQPALFVKIQGLAKECGVPLYRKVGQRLELTAQGEHFAAYARDTIRSADIFMDKLAGKTGEEPVVLAAGEGAFLHLLGGPIKQFLKKHSKLRLLNGDRDAVINAVCSGRADLGVASLETVPPDCESTVFFTADQMLALPATHRLASKRRVGLSDLANEDLIVPPSNRPHRQNLSQALRSADVPWNVAVEASGWQLMIQFVQLGVGIAVVNSMCNLPRGLVGKPLAELPRIHYHLFHMRTRAQTGPASKLKQLIATSHAG